MRLKALKIRDFRTLLSLDIEFPTLYTAICGPNDCGKTNIVRALRTLVKESWFPFFGFGDDDADFSIKEDYPRWKQTATGDRQIQVELTFEVHRERDAGFFQSIDKQLSLDAKDSDVQFTLQTTYKADKSEPDVQVVCMGQVYTGIQAQEVLKRLQSSRSILFHNSTQIDLPQPFRPNTMGRYFRAVSPGQEAIIAGLKKTVTRGLSKITKSHKQALEALLGRLEKKYTVGLSIPAFDFASVPYIMTLGEKRIEVPLDDWGSGTKNRTLILLTLFRAKQLSAAEASASKVTPVIFIEEPESFLHPAAQAEFGRILRHIADEFQVQVVATTHSPYLLNMESPQSNVLLERRTYYKESRETERVDTSGDNWMKPFGVALGLESDEFRPWKELILGKSEGVLLVEGSTDKEYFEMLRGEAHGANRLEFSGEILPYDGTGCLKNTVLLRFIKNKYRRFFVTFDLDAESDVERSLVALGLEKKKHYLPIGLDQAGKRNIEGLLPDSVTTKVFGSQAALVQAATAGTRSEKDSARAALKKLMLDEFKAQAAGGEMQIFRGFYPVIRAINTAIREE